MGMGFYRSELTLIFHAHTVWIRGPVGPLSAQTQETPGLKGKSEPRGADAGSTPKIKSLELMWWEGQEESKKRVFKDF